MMKKGVVDEEKMDSFNIPVYNMSSEELAEAIDRNGCFSIEEISEQLPHGARSDVTFLQAKSSMNVRAILEILVKDHFGEEILDELFDFTQRKSKNQPSSLVLGRLLTYLFFLSANSFAKYILQIFVLKLHHVQMLRIKECLEVKP
ncbi:SAM dependent carboxyl methyltransferase [Quillaja saponaria]|uniref:SAM dependent carboxyl methyltransferase n=1 Tax=Quillaja saponaria TaxID=32244 RepID=A0AAD7VGV5_QUISA|nr:SAM dependent carboxyl methyltransferase [Quillaja saponaria]